MCNPRQHARSGSGAPKHVGAAAFAAVMWFALVFRANASLMYQEPVSFQVGNNPFSVAAGDLNGDHRLDLVVGNLSSNTVSVLFGKAIGTLGSRTDIATGEAPSSVALGDFNGDGRLDITVANSASNTISVILGNGDGSFKPRVDYAAGRGPSRVAIADLNGDRRADLAILNSVANSVSVLLGNGDGTFRALGDFRIGISPNAMAVGDVNGDSIPDVVTANAFGVPVSVLLGRGDGTFAPKSDVQFMALNPSSIAIKDIDGDGRADLTVSSLGFDVVTMLRQLPDGTFEVLSQLGIGLSPIAVVVEDLDGDGRPDLAVSNVTSSSIAVLLQKTRGQFEPEPDLVPGEYPSALIAADLDADGKLDLIATNNLSNSVSVFRTGQDPVAMGFRLARHRLNLDSDHRYIAAYLSPTAPFEIRDIDVSSIRLNGTVPVAPGTEVSIRHHEHHGVPELRVRFSRAALVATLPKQMNAVVTATGRVAGREFLGTDTVHVRRAEISAPVGGHVSAGGVLPVRWRSLPGSDLSSVALLHSLDGGGTWSIIARRQPRSGSFDWRVPDAQSPKALLAVAEESDAKQAAELMDDVIGMSLAFAVDQPAPAMDRSWMESGLAIRLATSNPTVARDLRLELSLMGAQRATLQVLDVAGRVVSTRDIGGLGQGRHLIDLRDTGELHPGIYFLRLVQGDHVVNARVAIMR